MSEPDSELEDMKSFYDDVYYANANKPLQGSTHLLNLADKIDVAAEDRVLDIACGLGEWLHVCAKAGAQVHGVDLSERAIEYCRKHLPDGDFHAVPAETLPFDDAQFDVVSCLGSLEHFVEPVIALREMARVAKPDAKILILVPNADFLTRKIGFFGGTNQKDAKEVVRTLEEWEALLNQAELVVSRKWKDLHVLSWNWISMNGWLAAPLRALQALALVFWPLRWQYQVYHLCVKTEIKKNHPPQSATDGL
ncbi:MAG: class I SAM-dependent methyltransferase [Woeseiaceae bacterium]